jgi:hypothetical protein
MFSVGPTSLELPYRLLLACLSPDVWPEDAAVCADASPADWSATARLSFEHRVAPLLYWRLRNRWDEFHINATLRQELEAAYRGAVFEHQRVFRGVEQALAALNKAQIPVISLKGVYLAAQVYAIPGLRPMTDIDFIVPSDRLDQAVQALSALGYRSRPSAMIKADRQNLHALPQLEMPGYYPIDLHWALVPATAPFHIPVKEIWERAHPGLLNGQPILELACEDFLLHLCLHAAYLDYFSSGLRPYCDIAWTVSAYGEQINWSTLAALAQQWGAERSLWLALSIAARLLRAAIPGEILAGPNDELASDRAEWAITQVFNPAKMSGKLASAWAPLPWSGRLSQAAHAILPEAWEMRQAYPSLARGLFWPLAYGKHLGVVFSRNWPRAWGLVRGSATDRAEALQRERVNQLIAWQGSPPNSPDDGMKVEIG